MRVLGAILAGGQARRFGSDKAQATWRGRPLIDHVEQALGRQVEAVVRCGGADGLADRPGGGLGPLAGIAAALAHAAANGFDAVLSVPCDMPVLPGRLAERLCGAGAAYLDACPVIGCWPATLAGPLDRFLAAGGTRSVRAWATAAGARAVALDAGEPLPVNVNRPADLAALDKPRTR